MSATLQSWVPLSDGGSSKHEKFAARQAPPRGAEDLRAVVAATNIEDLSTSISDTGSELSAATTLSGVTELELKE